MVDGKWSGFREVFADFDVDAVAALSDDDVDRIAGDGVIKYRVELAAVVKNARAMAAIAGRVVGGPGHPAGVSFKRRSDVEFQTKGGRRGLQGGAQRSTSLHEAPKLSDGYSDARGEGP